MKKIIKCLMLSLLLTFSTATYSSTAINDTSIQMADPVWPPVEQK